MSKVILALGSFMVGACSVFFMFSGSHPSILEHPVLAQSMIGTRGVPVVPPLGGLVEDGSFTAAPQTLDGLNCVRCSFDNATLTYGGGTFKLTDCKFEGTTRVFLSGAAANTLAVLPLLEAIAQGGAPKAPVPQKPIEKEATAKQLLTVSFDSPYGQK